MLMKVNSPTRIASRPARYADTVGSYAPLRCAVQGCTEPARYHGHCFRHWRQAHPEPAPTPTQETPMSDAPPNGDAQEASRHGRTPAISNDAFREVVAHAASNAEVASQLGMSDGRVATRCKQLGIRTPAQRLRQREPTPQAPDTFFRTSDALGAIVTALRTLPDNGTRRDVLTAARLLIEDAIDA